MKAMIIHRAEPREHHRAGPIFLGEGSVLQQLLHLNRGAFYERMQREAAKRVTISPAEKALTVNILRFDPAGVTVKIFDRFPTHIFVSRLNSPHGSVPRQVQNSSRA